jgi:diadenosine tetraphosphate (Ap4A) HIT family hydrolase
MAGFNIDKRLEQDTFFVGSLPLSDILLHGNAFFPWFILLPRRNAVKEIIDLRGDDQLILLEEIKILSKFIKKNFLCQKLNVANLGNIVSQLHIHVIARHDQDVAWPKPVWGAVGAKKYKSNEVEKIKSDFGYYIKSKDLEVR